MQVIYQRYIFDRAENLADSTVMIIYIVQLVIIVIYNMCHVSKVYNLILRHYMICLQYGRAALEAVMKSVLGQENPLVPPPMDYKGNFFEDVKMGLVGVGMISIENSMGYASLEKGNFF